MRPGSTPPSGRQAAARLIAASAILLSLSAPATARAADKLFAGFHFDLALGTFFMSDERGLGRDIEKGQMDYFDPYLGAWFTGGITVRPHPLVGIDLSSGVARWTGRGLDWTSMLLWDATFRIKETFVPLELTVTVSLVESQSTFLGLCFGPGFYAMFRRLEGPHDVDSFGKGYGFGGKLALVVGFSRKGPFEFNLELGYRLTRIVHWETEGGIDYGDFKPSFSGIFLGLRFMFGAGTADPLAAKKQEPAPAPAAAPAQPAYAPPPAYAPQPVQQPAPQPAPQPAAPIPPSGAHQG